ncbi:hypothetical protein DXG03_007408 [Asterophora parasitica]|uniref:Cytochrome P450 n=1 Tax=Asterophora parasitica TaxID=117018 RepID=A0A9P7GA35_9AGAR|nr:hypothetical protein DXG03_007408 [Asterophora parasitica]
MSTVLVLYYSRRLQLNKIPTIGPSGILTSYLGAYKVLFNARDMIQEGYSKYRGGIFKVPGISSWIIVVSGPKLVDELRKAKDAEISLHEAGRETLQIEHTIGPSVQHDPYHISIVRSALTRSLVERFPDVQDEITTAFAEHIPPTEDWSTVVALPIIMEIVCRTSNRLFVGLPLCRDPDYISLNIEFTVDVMKAATAINLFPTFLKPLKRAMSLLGPTINERLRQEELYGKDWPGKPNDALSWLLDIANGDQRTVRDLTLRILAINFAAIHTTSMAFTQILFDLAAHPSYVPALREEIETVIREDGLTKMSLHKMRKLDSFIKESQRIGGNGVLAMPRKVLKDFTFSDGTVVPKGYLIAVANFSMHHDEEHYTNPNEFEGFRFAHFRDSETEGFSKHQMVSLGLDYIVFGHGRHACPGRFFAVNELKAILAHVLLNYDVAFETGERPADRWFGFASVPDPTASIMFRKRCS